MIEKIENITKSETITKNTLNYKPSLLILDEVDGTAESEYSGAMTKLMKFIYGEDEAGKGGLKRSATSGLRKGDTNVTNADDDDHDDENDKTKGDKMGKDADGKFLSRE